jgi:molecular chaperone GrpE
VSNQNEENAIPKEDKNREEGQTSNTDAGTDAGSYEKALEEAKQKAEENWNLFLRTRADVDNIRRRAQLDNENARKFAIDKFARELLVVVDSLEHGIQVAENAGDNAYREGMALTLKLFLDILEKFDVQRIDPKGEVFDPNRHEAISMLENSEVAPNTVLVVAQAGFVLNDRVLRPARVVVAKAAGA